MKKIILSLAVILTAVFAANAQIGIRGGVGFANVKYTDGNVDFSPESKLGLSAGISKEIKVIGKYVKLAPELLFDVKGSRGEEVELTKTFYGASYNYLGLGLGVKVNLPVIPIYVLGQPYYQYLISGQSIVDVDGDVTKTKIDDFGDMNRSELGVNLGLGTSLHIGPVGLFLEARYAVPMTSLEEINETENYKLKNKFFTVSVGILIGGK